MLPIKLPKEPAKETDAAAGETPSVAWHLPVIALQEKINSSREGGGGRCLVVKYRDDLE